MSVASPAFPVLVSDLSASQRQVITGVSSMSSGKFSQLVARATDRAMGRRDVLAYRQAFAEVWQRFCLQNFDSPAHAAHVFQVDPSTADKWFAGLNAPSGWVVGRAIADPDLREAALALLAGGAA